MPTSYITESGMNRAGADSDNRHPRRTNLQAYRLTERRHECLGGRINGKIRDEQVSSQRSYVDNPPPCSSMRGSKALVNSATATTFTCSIR